MRFCTTTEILGLCALVVPAFAISSLVWAGGSVELRRVALSFFASDKGGTALDSRKVLVHGMN